MPLGTLSACHAPSRFSPHRADVDTRCEIRRQRQLVQAVRGSFDIDAAARRAEALRVQTRGPLGLEDVLSLATRTSREYLSAREDVYLAALAVTGERAARRLQYGGAVDFEAQHTDGDASVRLDRDASLLLPLSTGGQALVSLTSELLRDFTRSPLDVTRTLLSSRIVLPLARGSGRLVVLEALRQAERDLVYALRSYARFQRTFTVELAVAFYRALRLRDVERNETATYRSLETLVEEQADKAASNRIPLVRVDQARQDLLRADDRRKRAAADYAEAIDALKFAMGLPVEIPLELEHEALTALRQEGLGPKPPPEAALLRMGLSHRLDFATTTDQVIDAARHVQVARDALRMQLDLEIGTDVSTPQQRPFDLLDATLDQVVGINLDLPLERTAERNRVRARMVALLRARRARASARDGVVREIRNALREIREARRSHAVQTESLRLAERRVEGTALLLESGGATIRDRLEAEDALRGARNALTGARIEHRLGRLRLGLAAGGLCVDEAGRWILLRPRGTMPAPSSPPASEEQVQVHDR